MAERAAQERTQKATGKRLKEARESGNVPRSREFTTAALLLAASGGMLLLGGHMLRSLDAIFHQQLVISRADIFDDHFLVAALKEGFSQALWFMAPFYLLMTVVAVLASTAVGGLSFSTKALTWNLERLDPVKGLKRVFGLGGLMEVAKALAKFTLVAGVVVMVLWHWSNDLMALGTQAVKPALQHASHLIGWSMLLISCGMILVAAVDVPFQRWQYARQLKMTRQEVKDEVKETEGRPEVKRRVRRMQMEVSRRRMMAEVPKADVVVVNPQHYAVALRYDKLRMGAPVVVAKGADYVALQIRTIAVSHKVPILSAPSLARAIYYSTELNKEIPAGLYVAVAKVLAYVYQLRRRHRAGADVPLTLDDDLPIPDDLKRDD